VGWGRGGWGLALAQWGQQERLVVGVEDDATDSAGSGCSSVGVVAEEGHTNTPILLHSGGEFLARHIEALGQ
jgi:hypothetical protein